MILISDNIVISLTSAILVALPPTILAIGNMIMNIRNSGKVAQVKSLVNGRMDELLRVSRSLAHHQGKLDGKQEVLAEIKSSNELTTS